MAKGRQDKTTRTVKATPEIEIDPGEFVGLGTDVPYVFVERDPETLSRGERARLWLIAHPDEWVIVHENLATYALAHRLVLSYRRSKPSRLDAGATGRRVPAKS